MSKPTNSKINLLEGTSESSVEIFFNSETKKWEAIITINKGNSIELYKSDIDIKIRDIINGTVEAVKMSQKLKN